MSFVPSKQISELLAIMAALRTPVSGCPWDLEQTFATIVPFTIEEAFEVADAVDRGDFDDLRDELGDLLLQVVFHARMAEEQGRFDFGDVVEAITQKLIRRHPHIFGTARDLSSGEVKRLWATIKQAEKAERNAKRATAHELHLDAVATALPALTRAVKLQSRASEVGFDWNDAGLVLDKIREETAEVAEAISAGDPADIEDEIGDLLFAVVNLARHARVDPEVALRAANVKFTRRFGYIEQSLGKRGEALRDASLTAMEALWTEAKQREQSER